jgi:hypothetical protein
MCWRTLTKNANLTYQSFQLQESPPEQQETWPVQGLRAAHQAAEGCP